MDPLIIQFPRKFDVHRTLDRFNFSFNVSVPKEHEDEVAALLRQQPWVSAVSVKIYEKNGNILVFVSLAYEISEAQAIEALSRLCEHVISPTVEIDAGLAGELEALV